MKSKATRMIELEAERAKLVMERQDFYSSTYSSNPEINVSLYGEDNYYCGIVGEMTELYYTMSEEDLDEYLRLINTMRELIG